MLKSRILLAGAGLLLIILIFQLPKSVVENETNVAAEADDSVASHIERIVQAPPDVRDRITLVRAEMAKNSGNQKNAIFADSLAGLYRSFNRFDSAAWYAGEAASFFNTVEHWEKAGDLYYQAYSIEVDEARQKSFAEKAQEFYAKVLEQQPGNLAVKTRLAMTYLSTATPMQGIAMLREVLGEDPDNELALFNMGMLSIQSGQYPRAVDYLKKLTAINPGHVQGHLLFGIALMNTGDRESARSQFEKVKKMDEDPAVQATVDSYLKDLK